jgi:tetratricopeptide (TPR) repeat protein
LAADGEFADTRYLAEYLVRTRREKPNLQLYRALILSNIDTKHGAAWRVSDLLDEMVAEGLQMDVGICHAVLKVVAVHLDHLLREDVLDYMTKRWYTLTVDGAHDVAAGYFREGRFEQALLQMGKMRKENMPIDRWLWDMSLYTLCDAGEIEEAYRSVRTRWDSPGTTRIGRGIWWRLLDKASEARHHDGTSLAWQCQVTPGYMNPSSGMCLNVLATAAHAGDAALATEVFSHLSKRGTAFQPIHYELLISAYLAADPPDVNRAISILTIMPLEKLEPSIIETRSLFLYLKDKPNLVDQAFKHLRSLHSQNRKIPIAVLNLLIECYAAQHNLPEALKIYKLIHTFAPIDQGASKSYANIETFNLLFRACRTANPPDEKQASFLVSELLALRITPTPLTYDRLILVFVEAARAALKSAPDSSASTSPEAKAKLLLDWAFRHLIDMQPLNWMPRFGTLELLAVQLATVGDERCWDVMQLAGDAGEEKVSGWQKKGRLARANVEREWERVMGEKGEAGGHIGGTEGGRE